MPHRKVFPHAATLTATLFSLQASTHSGRTGPSGLLLPRSHTPCAAADPSPLSSQIHPKLPHAHPRGDCRLRFRSRRPSRHDPSSRCVRVLSVVCHPSAPVLILGPHPLAHRLCSSGAFLALSSCVSSRLSKAADRRAPIVKFLASVAVRIERQARAARKALLKTSSQPTTSGPTPVATRSSSAAPSASFSQNDVSLQLGADPIRPLFSSLRSSLQPPKPPSVVTDPATSPEQDLFPDMSFPAEWFSAVSPQQMADRPKYGDEPPPPLEGTIGGLNLDLDLNQFLGFDTQSPTLDGWGPWGEWAG